MGITGGIGSGKTTICKVFETLNIPIFYADSIGKKLLNSDSEVITQVKEAFGEEMYSEEGLDRKKMAAHVFGDKKALQKLNSIVHPAVGKAFDKWSSEQNSKYLLKEAAILFESGSHKSLDAVIYVYAPEVIRIKRVMNRDGVTEKEVKSRMANQWDDEKKRKLSDFVIFNDGSQAVIPQVLALHQKLNV